MSLVSEINNVLNRHGERDLANAAASRPYTHLLDFKDWSEYKVVHPQKAKMSSSLEVELGSMQDGARLGATIEFDEHQDRNSADQFSKLGAWMDNNGADILTNDDFFDDLAFGSNNESPNTKPVAAPTAKPSSKLPMSSRRK